MLEGFNEGYQMSSLDYEDALIRINKAITLAHEFGCIDGEHHKAWVIDQMIRELTTVNYEKFLEVYCRGEDGPDTYEWDVGIAP